MFVYNEGSIICFRTSFTKSARKVSFVDRCSEQNFVFKEL